MCAPRQVRPMVAAASGGRDQEGGEALCVGVSAFAFQVGGWQNKDRKMLFTTSFSLLAAPHPFPPLSAGNQRSCYHQGCSRNQVLPQPSNAGPADTITYVLGAPQGLGAPGPAPDGVPCGCTC